MDNRTISFELRDSTGYTVKFDSLSALYEFATIEKDFWKAQRERISSKIRLNSYPHINQSSIFQTIVSTIEGWENQLDEWDESRLNQEITNLRNNQLRNISSHWLWSGHPFNEPYMQCIVEHGEATGSAFLEYVIHNKVQNTQSFDHFRGYLYAYEFSNQDSSIVKRRYGEKVSLGHLRNQFAKTKDELFSETQSLKSEFLTWDKNTRNQSERLYKAQKYLGEKKVKSQDAKFDEKLRQWNTSITELESTYEEHLKLKKPAEYWNKAASRYGRQGGLWSISIVALVIVGLIYFREFFIYWLQGKEIGIQLNSIQGIILFGSIITVYGFLLKVLSRLAFSSFHLMRDAEEREQLTYLYLSLLKDAAVDEESRNIVLQALFSRSETGLLAKDHGPTMPGASEFIKGVSKVK